MATVGSRNLTLLDWARRTQDGKTVRIAEMLNETNEILDDLVVIEGNSTSGHTTTYRTGLPEVGWRMINDGVQPSLSKTATIEQSCGILEAYGQVDEELLALVQDPANFRLSENSAFIEAMSQAMADQFWYGNARTNKERFTGISNFYNDSTASSGKNIIKAGSSDTDNTSMWLIVFGEETIHSFFPKSSRAGIQHEDKGKQKVTTSDGKILYMFEDQYKWKMGLAVRDWRYAVRICNIDVSLLATAGDGTDNSTNLIKHMIKAKNLIPHLGKGKAAWYCNRDVKTALDIKAIEKTNNTLTIQTLETGKDITKFLGIPIRLSDALVNNEALVS